MKSYQKLYNKVFLLLSFVLITSCEDLLEISDPVGQISNDHLFNEESTATAAITSMYAKLRDDTLLTGDYAGMTMLLGLYADEFDYYSIHGFAPESFYNHTIIASNDFVKNFWDKSYQLIYLSNSAIEGLENSTELRFEIKQQLLGEALFIRALTHFYIVNLFGDIPYVKTTDHLINKSIKRNSKQEVYNFIIQDLIRSKSLLSENYLSEERTRANKFVVSAILSKVYLYTENWELSKNEASEVINSSNLFYLEQSLNDEFLKNSNSTIFQFKPKLPGDNTMEADIFLFEYGPPFYVAISESFYNSFEENDMRKSNWIHLVMQDGDIWYVPYKYKIKSNTGQSSEFSKVFRLSEQHLIRAEALAKMGLYQEALNDINLIRNRSGLPNSLANSENEIIAAISNEIKHELFAEHGNRWFDLQRRGSANQILQPIKPNWRDTDVIFPIPESEILLNPNLKPQNPGY